jgi:hypothetical protein
MVKQYKLVNPTVVGSIDTTVKAGSADNAMKSIWEKLSEHIMGNVPKIMVTIRENGTDKLFHYKIKETVNDSKEGHISFDQVKVNLSAALKKEFLSRSDSARSQSGGKSDKKKRSRYDDSSDSDSDSDDEFYKFMKFRKNSPISYYWYTPYLYTSLGTSLTLYNPVFKYPLIPYQEIWIPKIL